jgi:serine/threonine protein kinase
MPTDPKLVREHFLAAAELPAAEREVYLVARCGGDSELRAAVERLLAAHDQPASVLNRPVPGSAEHTTAYGPSEQPGAVIAGRYKLLESIGEGGMGAVWAAEQTQPVRRKVALKLIKAGMDSKSVVARFEAERQALAVMEHPNIAKVLDGGLTETGRPFFVMEYVKGVPITEYCDATRLSIPDRLNLFVQVCHAVQHAHHKGIIHRDLKPSNILVAPYDDKPVPKVIDFGLAKAMHQSLTERTLHTAHEMVLGTPLYMSPEQAQLNNLDVDTRSDIYSLGVLLYEMLTGTTPLEKQRFKEAAWDEIRRIIREEEPPRPSTRLSSSQALPSLAAGRHTEPTRLTKLVRGDLDWIVMRSLEKDRTRRYETANGFAMDIQRYLAGEPVLAVPPSARYRLRKFARKNRGLLTTIGAFVFVLIASTAFSAWQAYRASKAEWVARQAEAEAIAERNAATTARDAEHVARQNAEDQRIQAEANFKKARDAVDEYFTRISESTLLNVPGLQPLRKELLESARRYYQDFLSQRSDDTNLRAEVGAASYRVAIITELLGTADQARPALEQARAVYLELTRDHPSVTKYWVDLAICDNDLGRFHHQVNDRDAAYRYHREAQEIRERNAREHPDGARFQDELVRSFANLSMLALDDGQVTTALELVEQAVAILERVTRDAAPATQLDLPTELGRAYNSIGMLRIALAGHYARLGYLQRRADRPEEALRSFRKSLTILESLLAADPTNMNYQGAYAATGTNVCSLLDFMGRVDEASAATRKVKPVVERLIAENPHVPGYKSNLAVLLTLHGVQSTKAGQFDEAVPLLREALTLFERLGAENPRAAYYQHRIAAACRHLGLIPPPHLAQDEGLNLLRRSESILQDLPNPDTVAIYDLACTQALIGGRLGHGGAEAAECERYAGRAMETLGRAIAVGYKDVANIRSDTDLDTLRGREDFKKLLAELGAEAH